MIFEKIRKSLNKANQGVCHLCGCDLYSEDTINIINQVEAEYNNGWIACSEKLPENYATVWVTYINLGKENATTGYYDKEDGYWYLGHYEFKTKNVIAWQPLPQPPKGE